MKYKEIKPMNIIVYKDWIRVSNISFSFIERIKIFLTILFRQYFDFQTTKGIEINYHNSENIGEKKDG